MLFEPNIIYWRCFFGLEGQIPDLRLDSLLQIAKVKGNVPHWRISRLSVVKVWATIGRERVEKHSISSPDPASRSHLRQISGIVI
jgi:hypothetical protein